MDQMSILNTFLSNLGLIEFHHLTKKLINIEELQITIR